MSGIDALLASLPSWTLVGGKGGVGKTTCAAALALRSARRGTRTLVLSTDPAGTLADALGAPLGGEPRPVPNVASLYASQLDATAARTDFLRQWGDVLATIVDRGTYLDREDIRGLIDVTLPGIDETMAVLALADLAQEGEWDCVILDTAPTGHTLRLLELPDTFRALIDLLDTMQGKHRFMVSALMHRYRPDEADAFIASLRAKVDALRALTTDSARMGVVLVTRPEAVVVAETTRYAAALAELRMIVRAVVVNAVPDSASAGLDADVGSVRQLVADAAVFGVRDCGRLAPGVAGVERWGRAVRRLPDARRSARRAPRTEQARRRAITALPPAAPTLEALPPVVIVGGKGGVGKTTVSCAVALASARGGQRVLLVSTDPAPSIADALGQPVRDDEVEVNDGFGLHARQIDATAAFARWRTHYQARVDSAFDALLGPGLDATHDRAIARQLLALAPPGIDELYALIWLGDALADREYDRIVIDPAPTGHLMRLLEMPALALDWAHRLLRLMLKYRELSGGGDLARELIGFARRTRAVSALLEDPTQAGVLVVALDEPLVRVAAERIVQQLGVLGSYVPGVIWNRVETPPPLLPGDPPIRQLIAPESSPPPVGATTLLAWYDTWYAAR